MRAIHERFVFIDILKGMAICLVVLGHVYALPKMLLVYIYSFHMPLFFFISGYLLNYKKLELDLKEYIKLKWKRLINPYFGMAFFCYVYFVLILGGWRILQGDSIDLYFFIKPLWGIFYSLGTTVWMPNCSPLWFLTCLFCVEMLFYIIYRKCNGGGGANGYYINVWTNWIHFSFICSV